MSTEPGLPAGRPESSWVKRLARALLTLYFRRVEVTGLDAIPKGSGGLLIAWHPNGLIDPALVLATFPGRVVFGARHGLFRWPILRRVLTSVAVPIYRRQDMAPGADGGDAAAISSSRRNNAASLGALAEAVAGGSFAMLFPEGDSHDQPHPLDLKSGAARLYLDALARSGTGPPPAIIPIGLHYDQKRFFRSRALVAFQPPLDVAADFAAPAPASREAVSDAARREQVDRLTERFTGALEQATHATDDWRDHHLMHRLRRLLRAERADRAGASPGPVDMKERQLGFARIWTAFRELGEDRSEGVVALRRRVGAYDRLLRRLGLEDHELDRDPDAPHGLLLAVLVVQCIALVSLLPALAIVGLVANLPTALLLALVARLTAKRQKDVATIKLLLGAVFFPATWIALGLFAAWRQGALVELYPALASRPWLTGITVFVLSAVGGVLVLAYGRLSRRWGRSLLVRGKRRLFRRWVDRLLAERASIFDEATALAAELELPGRIGPSGEILD